MLGSLSELDDQVGRATPQQNLAQALETLFDFQERVLPLMASLFAEPELLASYREKFLSRRKGPAGGVVPLEQYLQAEQKLGRIDAALDGEMAARSLLAGCFFHVFTRLIFGSSAPFPKFASRLIRSELRDTSPE